MSELREQKSILAKLMASENITVRHAKVPTAGFDPKSRTLILPILKEMEGEVYDLFVCHEVGHALYTPAEGWHKVVSEQGPNYKSFLNIVEDARIEKLIKRKYHGAAKAMHAGYQVLMHERDFMGLKKYKIDINTAPLIDKLNIHFKGGLREAVRFTEEEMYFVHEMENLETWDDVEQLTGELWDWCSDREEQLQEFDEFQMQMDTEEDSDCEEDCEWDDNDNMQNIVPPSEDKENPENEEQVSKEDCDAPVDSCPESTDGDGPEEQLKADEDGNKPADQSKDESQEEAKPNNQAGRSEGGDDAWYDEDPWKWNKPEPQSITDQEFRAHEEELVHEEAIEIRYFNSPKLHIKNNGLIVTYKELMKVHKIRIEKKVADYEVESQLPFEYARKYLKLVDKDNKPVVNYLAKEFEMKKKAAEYKRSQTANSGLISLSDIHKYKYSDNIFKKVTIVPEGKNHGLYMLCDWSGSMHDKMIPTFIQLLQLVDFCRKCAIKHEVYAFVDYAYDEEGNDVLVKKEQRPLEDKIAGNISSAGNHRAVQLIEIFSDKMSAKDFREMREQLVVSLLRCDNEFHQAPYQENKRREAKIKAEVYDRKLKIIKETKQEIVWNMMKEENPELSTWDWSALCSRYNFPLSRLCGTPLNSAIMFSIPNANRFRKDNRLDIVNTIILTDGESNSAHSYWKEDEGVMRAYNIENQLGGDPVRNKLVDTETKKVFDWNRRSNWSETRNTLEYYKYKTFSNVVGFFLCTSGDTAGRIGSRDIQLKTGSTFNQESYTVAKSEYNRNGFFISKNLGYSELYVIKANKSVQTEDEIDLDTDKELSTAQITRAFKKFQKGKLEKRVLLNRFAEMVA